MVYIKKMVMSGFKSFARRTEILFDREVNVILGPNGSGKTNLSDAICFVLGRLSIKSIRAAKAKNLLFMGSKYIKPVKEAVVELVFDNTDRTFAVDKDEVHLIRIARNNGQGVYKINGELKTRTEVIEMLAQAGIDPYGFNIIQQGQIQSIVIMHSEDRRKIIEEVAGISIYESRKEKSLHELEKTDERLKEISAILRERSSYLRNLEKERSQALRFKELELTGKRCRASILNKKIEEKKKELASIIKSIQEKSDEKDKLKNEAEKLQNEIEKLNAGILEINKKIQQASGFEQENLRNQIANLKAELEGLKVRRENYENRRSEVELRIREMERSIPELENEIKELKKESPLMAKKAQELRKKKQEFEEIGEQRNNLMSVKSGLLSLKALIQDREKQLSKTKANSDRILKDIESYSANLECKNEEEGNNKIKKLKSEVIEKEKLLGELRNKELKNEKNIGISEAEIEKAKSIESRVREIDICPLCQSKITQEHIKHVLDDADKKIEKAQEIFNKAREEILKIKEQEKKIHDEIVSIKNIISITENEMIKHTAIEEKKKQLKTEVENEHELENEIKKIKEKRRAFEIKVQGLPGIEEKYDAKMLEIEEISSRTEEDADTTILYKERELENIRNVIKRGNKDLQDINNEIKNLLINIESRARALAEREKQEQELNSRFKKMFETRDSFQREIQEKSLELSEVQGEIRQYDEQVNYLKIGKAKLDAEKEVLDMEMQEFSGLELISGSLDALEERLRKTQEALIQIGSINMRALEVYEQVKKEYDIVQEKVNILEREKAEILKIIEEIDKKKTRTFMKTFKAINELFSQNFLKLSAKGTAFLELENEEDIFAGGVNIVVKLAKGKYFDVTSLSGGEQTLVALSLLFAIQEHKPYHFYIFDEIDAALDKRNSERLAALLHKYMKYGQYIIITHNDAIIMESNILYGVSMHDGVSKILSLKVGDEEKKEEGITTENKAA